MKDPQRDPETGATGLANLAGAVAVFALVAASRVWDVLADAKRLFAAASGAVIRGGESPAIYRHAQRAPRQCQPLDGHTCCAPSCVQRVLGGEPQTFVRLACDTH